MEIEEEITEEGIKVCESVKAYVDDFKKAFKKLKALKPNTDQLNTYLKYLKKSKDGRIDPKFYTRVFCSLIESKTQLEELQSFLDIYFIASETCNKLKFFTLYFIELIQAKPDKRQVQDYSDLIRNCLEEEISAEDFTTIFTSLINNERETKSFLDLYKKTFITCKEKNYNASFFTDLFHVFIKNNTPLEQIPRIMGIFEESFSLCLKNNFQFDHFSYCFIDFIKYNKPNDELLILYKEGSKFCEKYNHNPRYYVLVFRELISLSDNLEDFSKDLDKYHIAFKDRDVLYHDRVRDFAENYVIKVKGKTTL